MKIRVEGENIMQEPDCYGCYGTWIYGGIEIKTVCTICGTEIDDVTWPDGSKITGKEIVDADPDSPVCWSCQLQSE